MVSLLELSLTAGTAVLFRYLIKIATFELIGLGDYFDSTFEYKNEDPKNGRFGLMEFDR